MHDICNRYLREYFKVTDIMLSPAMNSFLAKMFRLILFLYASTCWYGVIVYSASAWPSQLIIKEDSKFNPGLKKLMIGSDTFFNFLEDTTVVIDKSLFIKRIVEDPHKAILITYPPKFGKSTNLRMLKAFLMMEQIGGGLEIDPTQTHAYYYFVNGMTSGTYGMQRYSKLPLISQHKDIINEYLGRRMVIEFSWLGAQTMDRKHYGFMQTLEPKLIELFNDHFYLSAALDLTMRNDNTNETYKKQCEENYDRYEKYVLEKELGNETEISETFQWLSKIMYEVYGKKVFILMDDFVRIFDHMIQSDITDVNEWQKILNFMKNFLKNTINNNPYVEKVICTGFIPASVKEMFDGIDNFVHYSALDGDLQDFYGFSKSEVNSLMDYFAIPPPLAKKAHEFYEGYTTKPNSNVSIYNGYSTARFLNCRNITHYWREWITSIDDLEHWFKIDKFRNIVQSLIKGETLEIEYQSLSKEHQPILFPPKPVVWGKDVKADEQSINTIFTLLFDIGYFTLANNVHIDEQKISQRKIVIRIPNQEMKEILQHKLDNPETPEVS